MEILAQKDARWANIKLGTSAFYIWAKGCTITEIAECIGTTPDVVNEKLNALPADENGNTGFAKDSTGQNCLVYWEKIEKAFPGIKINRVWSYDNEQVLENLKVGNRVIVEVPADPIGNPGGKHWVRYIGDQKLHDPWTGTERPTSDFPNPTGYCVISGEWTKTVSVEPVAPVEATQPETPADAPANEYKGLDLSNTDSVKAAIDAWYDVANGVYLGKAAICQALEVDATYSEEAIIESIKTLKAGFKSQVEASVAVPPVENVDGQGPDVTPATPAPATIADIAQHEKEAFISLVHNLETEVKSLLGL